ncbi:MAG TPA: hypothetical protein VGV92_04475 [Gammaproteobacteria bacterium]|nr:hypothetical protein [Gammaproteobacteria bacterium]
MKKPLLLISFLGLFGLSSLSFAETLHSMSKSQLEQAFINKTAVSIATDNLNGRTINNTFSMFLDGKGNILGRMSVKPDNEPQADQGTYSIKSNGTLYITWQHWDGAKKLCGHMFNTKNAYVAVDCADIFHTAFMKEDIALGNQLK